MKQVYLDTPVHQIVFYFTRALNMDEIGSLRSSMLARGFEDAAVGGYAFAGISTLQDCKDAVEDQWRLALDIKQVIVARIYDITHDDDLISGWIRRAGYP